MPKENIFICLILITSLLVLGCSSEDDITGEVVSEEDIYEPIPLEEIEQQGPIAETEDFVEEQAETLINETEENLEEQIDIINEILPEQPKYIIEEFKFPETSIVNTQNNVSLSLDDFKVEIKSSYWGKIIEITATILNKDHKAFKPKVIVLLHDEKDFKEEWLKPKAEIEFDIEKLNPGEHTTRQAIVNIAFDDINLTKDFKLILVDAADLGNKPIVVVENPFIPQP
jgi:hypothetical protein